MKIYFAGSIRGGRDLQQDYEKLIHHLERHGSVLTEHVGNQSILESGEKNKPDDWIFQRDVKWLNEANVMIAEVTLPSLGVGYEIGLAEKRGIPVLCLFKEDSGRSLSAMIVGNAYLTIAGYGTIHEAIASVDRFIRTISHAITDLSSD